MDANIHATAVAVFEVAVLIGVLCSFFVPALSLPYPTHVGFYVDVVWSIV